VTAVDVIVAKELTQYVQQSVAAGVNLASLLFTAAHL